MILSKVGDKWEWRQGEEAKYSRAAARRNWVSFPFLLVLRGYCLTGSSGFSHIIPTYWLRFSLGWI